MRNNTERNIQLIVIRIIPVVEDLERDLNHLFVLDSHCQTFEQQWQTTIQNGQMNLSRVQTPDESNRRQNNTNGNGTSNKKDSIPTDQNIHAKVQLQLDMLDCNYEQDKREYYAQLIRDLKKTTPIHELDKELKNRVSVRYLV